MTITHQNSLEVLKGIFKGEVVESIIKLNNDIYERRTVRKIDSDKLDEMILEEKQILKNLESKNAI